MSGRAKCLTSSNWQCVPFLSNVGHYSCTSRRKRFQFTSNRKQSNDVVFSKYAQVAASLLTSCNIQTCYQQADIRMCSHGLRQLVASGCQNTLSSTGLLKVGLTFTDCCDLAINCKKPVKWTICNRAVAFVSENGLEIQS